MTDIIRQKEKRNVTRVWSSAFAGRLLHAIVSGMRYLKTTLFLVLTVTLAPPYFFILLFLYPWRLRIGPWLIRFYSRICLLIYRVKIDRVQHFRTFRKRKQGLLIVSNHSSFLDIFVLSALFGAVFVSKAEVKCYPILGQIAWLSGVVFFDRAVHRERIQVLRTVAKRCTRQVIAVFPQGTTGRITDRLPFNRGIFKMLELNPEVTMLPVTIRYRDDAAIAWSGESLGENALRVGGQSIIHVMISIHRPVTAGEYEGKTAAEICGRVEETVLGNLEGEYRKT